ncbi:uncharacterized protein PSFLO_03483 [Pseudozyma flocculosa]|uniref:Uncharacterized protein n=1 Tax=Pseudozyma flocculosa TaxID=84751 RepID=A0A5C3F2A8_9BASI|nr:uncharacterized protein PSFLO_03483 [Pseudozyma flocculosa]
MASIFLSPSPLFAAIMDGMAWHGMAWHGWHGLADARTCSAALAAHLRALAGVGSSSLAWPPLICLSGSVQATRVACWPGLAWPGGAGWCGCLGWFARRPLRSSPLAPPHPLPPLCQPSLGLSVALARPSLVASSPRRLVALFLGPVTLYPLYLRYTPSHHDPPLRPIPWRASRLPVSLYPSPSPSPPPSPSPISFSLPIGAAAAAAVTTTSFQFLGLFTRSSPRTLAPSHPRNAGPCSSTSRQSIVQGSSHRRRRRRRLPVPSLPASTPARPPPTPRRLLPSSACHRLVALALPLCVPGRVTNRNHPPCLASLSLTLISNRTTAPALGLFPSRTRPRPRRLLHIVSTPVPRAHGRSQTTAAYRSARPSTDRGPFQLAPSAPLRAWAAAGLHRDIPRATLPLPASFHTRFGAHRPRSRPLDDRPRAWDLETSDWPAHASPPSFGSPYPVSRPQPITHGRNAPTSCPFAARAALLLQTTTHPHPSPLPTASCTGGLHPSPAPHHATCFCTSRR